MQRLVAVAALLVAVLVQALPAGAEPMDGRVTGVVRNATAGGPVPAGARVTLLILGVREQARIGDRATSVGADGRYAFDGLDRDPNIAYFVMVEHQGATYPHPAPFQLRESPTREADVQVYDATSTDESLRYERVALLLTAAEDGVLHLLQMGAVVNTGDRTFVPSALGDGPLATAVRFGLPRGAMGVRAQGGMRDEDLLDAVGGVQAALALKPGRHEYALSFQLPYSASSADLSLLLPYPAAAFTVYVPANGPRLEGGTLASQGPAVLGGQSFAQYGAAELGRNLVVSARLEGLPWAGGPGLSPAQLGIISLGVALVVLSLGLWVTGRRSAAATLSSPQGAAPTAGLPDLADAERHGLVLRIALLDERFAAGEIDEAEYRRQRDAGKRRLLEMARQVGAP